MAKNIIKRHFYNGQHYQLDHQTKTVKLLPDFHKKLADKALWGKFGFKKVGGSSVGDVLLTDSFKSQFGAFCRISWIGVPILNRKYVDAGIAIEPMVIEAIESKSNEKVQTFDPYKYNFDFFQGKDDVIGGLPDGFLETKKLVIEIKTSGLKKKDDWATYGVPLAYLKQSQLYTYLMNKHIDNQIEEYIVVATFLQEGDYADPSKFPIKQRFIKTWKYKLNLQEAEDDIKKIKEWYKEHTTSGESCKWDEKRDGDLIQWLQCSNVEEWETLKKKWINEGKIVE